MSDSCCCCKCCCNLEEDTKPLNPGSRQPITNQPSSQKYTQHEKREQEMYDISRDEKDKLQQKLHDLQSPSQQEEESHKKEKERHYLEVDGLKMKIASLESKNEELHKSHKNEIERHDLQVNGLKIEIDSYKSKNDELLKRLSESASARLTDGNPNIADLSDMNRPTKLSEQFSELYDNEWTDAFEALEKQQAGDKPEEEACKLLLLILTTIYTRCYEKSNEGLHEITKTLSSFSGMDVPSKEVLKALKEDRKKNHGYMIKKLREEIKSSLKSVIKEQKESVVQNFIGKCTTLCWLMTIQDPPVSIDVKIDRHDEALDTNKYKHYTKSGKVIDFIVWPALYLYEGGTLLNKGIAQGMESEIDEGGTFLDKGIVQEEESEIDERGTLLNKGDAQGKESEIDEGGTPLNKGIAQGKESEIDEGGTPLNKGIAQGKESEIDEGGTPLNKGIAQGKESEIDEGGTPLNKGIAQGKESEIDEGGTLLNKGIAKGKESEIESTQF